MSLSLAKIHALSGVLGVGLFGIVHLGAQAFRLRDDELWSQWWAAWQAVPGRTIWELLFIYLPLVVHLGTGLVLPLRPPGDPRVKGLLAGGAKLVLGLFLVVHLVQFSGQILNQPTGGAVLSEELRRTLSQTRFGIPWAALGTLLALAAYSLYIALGLEALMANLQRGTASWRWLPGVLGWGIFVGSAAAVLQLATGGLHLP